MTQLHLGVESAIQKESDAIEIHHVGSTSIPGCGGKGSIDIAVAYADGQLEHARGIIDGLGFQRQKTRDTFPESRPMRTGAINCAGKTYKIHVHILPKNSEEFEKMVRFRDRLKDNDDKRLEYIKLKKRILKKGVQDSIEYSELKEVFFEED